MACFPGTLDSRSASADGCLSRVYSARPGRAPSKIAIGRKLKKVIAKSRRQHKRIETPEGVWVLWKCGRTEDTSRVKDLGVGGLFLETKKVCPVDATLELHFLVQDGEIRASASVRFITEGVGMGVQFKTIRSEDQQRFAAMIRRIIVGE